MRYHARSHRASTLALSLATALALAACGDGGDGTGPDDDDPPRTLRLEQVASGLEQPVYLTAPEGDDRLFVVEQTGAVVVIEDGAVRDQPFLDLSDRVGFGGERGLLGMAFHPDFASNGRVFVNFTAKDGDTRIEEYEADPVTGVADPASATLLLEVEQPFSNHNGGHLTFGPDGMLYAGLGDGGGSGDPMENGQDPRTLLGAILRLDVDGAPPFVVPPDNPFVGTNEGAGEVWAYGLRNPWRFSFDAATGALFVADVGQNRFEEVNVAPADSAGVNYGWNVMEGLECFAAATCDTTGLHQPVLVYDRDLGCSVTGGFVYRGPSAPSLRGLYVFGDFCQGWIRTLRVEDGRALASTELDLPSPGRITSFGVDDDDELYVLTAGGEVFRFVED